jgi:hypothetical protein
MKNMGTLPNAGQSLQGEGILQYMNPRVRHLEKDPSALSASLFQIQVQIQIHIQIRIQIVLLRFQPKILVPKMSFPQQKSTYLKSRLT